MNILLNLELSIKKFIDFDFILIIIYIYIIFEWKPRVPLTPRNSLTNFKKWHKYQLYYSVG